MEAPQSNLTIRNTFNLLRLTFGIVPIVAGLDKFSNILTQWGNYLHPGLAELLPFSPQSFMMIVGVIEILAGVLVLAKPAVGGLIVSAWLALIAITLIASGSYLDVAVRDLVMGVGAFSMARVGKAIVDTQRKFVPVTNPGAQIKSRPIAN